MPDSALPDSDFTNVQKQFAQSIRSQSSPIPFPNMEERRLKVYRDLFYNNVESFIASAFPVLKEIILFQHGEAYWHERVKEFFIQHKCETPYFLEISEEFLNYFQEALGEQYLSELPDYAWQLAHWEWMELHADVADAQTSMVISTKSPEQILHSKLVLAETAWVCAYEFPVHKISTKNMNPDPVATYLMVYRNGQDEVGFHELNPLSATLFEMIRQRPGIQAHELLTGIAEQANLDLDTVVSGGLDILSQWQSLCILYAE